MVGKAESEVIRNDGEEARPWCLPFWTESPDYSMERDNRALALARREARDRREARRPAPKEVPAPESDDDIALILPTAEELENIRREAWNAGLEQGLVEGRQQGQKEGFDAGFKEGRDEGHKKGLNEGKGEGLKQGRDEGLAKGQQEIDAQVRQLQAIAGVMSHSVLERDAALPQVLARLVEQVCVQVLRYELTDGARRIGDYIRATLEQLPETERQQARIFISNVDANELVNDSTGELVEFRIDPSLKAGQCRIESLNSQAEYNVESHLQELLARLVPMLASQQPDNGELETDLEQAVEMEMERIQQAEEAEITAAPAAAGPDQAVQESEVQEAGPMLVADELQDYASDADSGIDFSLDADTLTSAADSAGQDFSDGATVEDDLTILAETAGEPASLHDEVLSSVSEAVDSDDGDDDEAV